MKISYPISLMAAAALFAATSASAQDNTMSLKEAFFPTGSVTPQMAEAIEAIPYVPATPGRNKITEQAAPYEGGMHGDWRPSVVTTAGEKGDNMYKYIYYYDKNGKYYSKDQSQVRVYQSWNATDNVWNNRMRLKLIIDDRGDIVEGYTDDGFKDQWNNHFRCTYTYDDNHNMLTAEQYTWYEDQWFSTLKWENTYDAAGNMVTQTYYNRPMGNEEWARGSQYTWEYDAAGNLTLYQIAHWSDVSQKYSPYLSQIYTYDAAGNLLTESQENYGNRNYLYSYTYNENNKKLTFLHQKWNGSEWTDYQSVDYSYDEQGRPKEDITKLWESDRWNPTYKKSYVYWELADMETTSVWDAENEKWKEQSNYIVRRDADDHIVCKANGEFDEESGHMQTQKQEVFEFQDNLLVCRKMQDWNGAEMKFDDISYFAFTYNDDRNCSNVTATAKQSKEWIIAPYNNMADEWGCPDYEPWIGNLEYLNINDYVEPTGITLDAEEITLEPDFSKQLTATVAPENVSNPEYYWTSSDDNVARVNVNGRVYAIAKGEATITATTMDNRFTAQCKVKVGETGISETVAEGNFAYTDGQILFTPANERHAISVFDISGKAVCLDDARTAISTSEWAPGLYIVKTTDGNTVKAYKIIVK